MQKATLVKIEDKTPTAQCYEHRAKGRTESTDLVRAFVPDNTDLPFLMQSEDSGAELSLIIECNGMCLPNPEGLGSWGLAVFCSEHNLIDMFYDDFGYGEGVTNNVAEYVAVIHALIWTAKYAADIPVEIRSSSQIVVNQINGIKACNAPHLKTLRDDAIELLRHTKATVLWIPIKINYVAESLAQLAYVLAKREEKGGGND